MADNKVYFNKSQRLTQLIGANTTIIVAGRRTGKTDSIIASLLCSIKKRNIIGRQYSFILISTSIVSLNLSFGKRFMYVARWSKSWRR